MRRQSSSVTRIPTSKTCPDDYTMVSGSWTSFELQIEGAKMASTTASAGNDLRVQSGDRISKDQIADSISRLSDWLGKNDYRGYDTFDGLNAYLRPLTFETKLLRIVLQQGVRRFPI